MALIAAHLNAGVIWQRQCSVRYSLPLSPTSWELGPRQYLGDNSVLVNKFNQQLTYFIFPVNVLREAPPSINY